MSADISVQVGEIQSHKKITIPEGGDVTKLLDLDMIQYNIAQAINTLNGKEKQERTNEYVKVLLQMYQLVSSQNNNSDVKKNSMMKA